MLDIVIAVLLGIVMLGTAYLGVHVTLHPAQSSRETLVYKIGFIVCGTVACILIAFQTYRNNAAQRDLRSVIGRIEKNTEQPPRVQVNVPPASVVIQNPSTAPVYPRIQANQDTGLRSLTNDRLRKETLALATKMRVFGKDMSRRLSLVSSSIAIENGVRGPDSQQSKQVYADALTVYNNTLLVDAVAFRFELWRRLGGVIPERGMEAFQKQKVEADYISDRGDPISDGAAYLETLAHRLRH